MVKIKMKVLKTIVKNCRECNNSLGIPTDDLSKFEGLYCTAFDEFKYICDVFDSTKEDFIIPDFCPLDDYKEEIIVHDKLIGCSNCKDSIIKKDNNNNKSKNVFCLKLNKMVYDKINIHSFCCKPLCCPIK